MALGVVVAALLAGATTGINANQVRTGTPASMDVTGISAAEGNALSLSRSDHRHSISGTLQQAQGGTGAGSLTCGVGSHLTSNGTAYSCSADATSPPGGSTTQVQFNDAGAFNGDAGLTYNKTTDILTAAGGLVAGDLASGRVVYATTAGRLAGDFTLTYTGSGTQILEVGYSPTAAAIQIKPVNSSIRFLGTGGADIGTLQASAVGTGRLLWLGSTFGASRVDGTTTTGGALSVTLGQNTRLNFTGSTAGNEYITSLAGTGLSTPSSFTATGGFIGNISGSAGSANAINGAVVSLTANVTGTLPINNGGTNSTATPTAGGLAYGTGTALAYSSAGSANQIMVSGGTGAPVFTSYAAVNGNVLAVTGSITATGDITAYYSDARLKTNVRPISDPWAKLDRLRGVEWKWREVKGVHLPKGGDAGLIAQEVQSVFPEAVGHNGEYLGLKVSNHAVTGLLVETVKELRKRVETLEARCPALAPIDRDSLRIRVVPLGDTP